MRHNLLKVLLLINSISIGFIYGIHTGLDTKKTTAYLIPRAEQSILGYATQVTPKVVYEDSAFGRLQKELDTTKGTFGLYIFDTKSEKTYSHNADEEFYAASVFKLFLVTSVFKQVEAGKISLDDKHKIEEDDKTGGTGILQYEEDKEKEYTVLELVTLALQKSDNTAQNILIRLVGKSYINEKVFTKDNYSSPQKVGLFTRNFYTNTYTSKDSTQVITQLLSTTDFDNRINNGLHKDIAFAHKIGTWPEGNAWHDCGLASYKEQTIIVCLMSQETTEQDFLNVSKQVGGFINTLFTDLE